MNNLHLFSLRLLLPVISCFSFYSVAAQNVGIGTTNPASTLDVIGAASKTGNFVNSVVSKQNTGVSGSCNNSPGFGYGISGHGGYTGVLGVATLSGTGQRYGVAGSAGNGVVNYGVYGIANNGTTAFGVYGDAVGATTNWAGYFRAGNVYIENNLGLGTLSPTLAKLQVQGAAGNTVAMFSSAANSQGLSLIADWPGLYFNAYYNGGAKSMAATGFAADIFADQDLGGIVFERPALLIHQ